MSTGSALEAALRHDRRWVIAALGAAVLVSWAWILPMALDMYGSMSGSAAWMMAPRWTLGHDLALLAMWLVMMTGMMLPSAAPALLIYAAVLRRAEPAGRTAGRIYAFAAGYLVVWFAFSIAATVLQRLLATADLLSPMMELRSPVLGGVLLIAAGVYQLLPFKQTCLQSCQSPVAYIANHWRAGAGGAWRMGVGHGVFCLGCCWVLMLLLFVGGVMNLAWIAAITIFVLAERLLPPRLQGGRTSGLALIALGVWFALR